MTVHWLNPPNADVIAPTGSEVSAPFWQGCRERRLLYQRCERCGAPNFDPVRFCRACGSDKLSWAESTGSGTVETWSVVWRAPSRHFQAPYAVVVVRLDEGHRMFANVVGCAAADVRSGLRVQVMFHPDPAGGFLPMFTPAAAE